MYHAPHVITKSIRARVRVSRPDVMAVESFKPTGLVRQELDEDQSVVEEKIINEEYKVWKKNAPFLYDVVVTHALEWPSLTVQWFPDVEVHSEKQHSLQRLLLGTHTSEGAPNYLQLATISLPNPNSNRPLDADAMDEERGEWNASSGPGKSSGCRINVSQRIPHEGEINRARSMPGNPCVIATRTPSGEVHIFDYTKHPSQPAADNKQSSPDLRLLGQSRDGYGLSWTSEGGLLAGASEDGTVCVWDVMSGSKDIKSLLPLRSFQAHTLPAEDVSWEMGSRDILASVGDDRRLCLWDLRMQSDKDPFACVVEAHTSEINSVHFCPSEKHMLATGGSDGIVALWDTRNLSQPVHHLTGHHGEILQVQWAPQLPGVLASAASDRRVHVWDLSRIGIEQDPEDAEDGPPELLFVHGGHTAKVSDLAWNPNEPWMLASVAEDNILQVWQMSSDIYNDNEDEADESEDEPSNADDSENESANDSNLNSEEEDDGVEDEDGGSEEDDKEVIKAKRARSD